MFHVFRPLLVIVAKVIVTWFNQQLPFVHQVNTVFIMSLHQLYFHLVWCFPSSTIALYLRTSLRVGQLQVLEILPQFRYNCSSGSVINYCFYTEVLRHSNQQSLYDLLCMWHNSGPLSQLISSVKHVHFAHSLSTDVPSGSLGFRPGANLSQNLF